MRTTVLTVATLALGISGTAQQATQPNDDHRLGYDDTPSYPGSKWKIHDSKRPRPSMVSAT